MKRGPGVLAHRRGEGGEERAVAHLKALGCEILARNFKTRFGELDIVARENRTIVYVEVKRREAGDHGTAAEYVDGKKMRKVVMAARLYAARFGLTDLPTRFDVIAIDGIDENEQLRHHRGAFDAR